MRLAPTDHRFAAELFAVVAANYAWQTPTEPQGARPKTANEVWLIDLVFDRTAEGRVLTHKSEI